MQIQRCPECGQRLKTNYCDICMRKVPFRGVRAPKSRDPWDSSSAHRMEEDHECVSFDIPEKKPKTVRRIKASKPVVKNSKQKASIIAIIVAVMSIISSLFGLIEEAIEPAPEPEYNYDAFVTDADIPAIMTTQLYYDGEIEITADTAGLYYDDYTVAVTIENGSEQDITVSTQQLSVNGYMLSCGLYADVEAGQTQQVFLQLYSYDLERSGIRQVAEIAFYLDIFDAHEYTQIATTDLLTLQTDIGDDYVQPTEHTGWELYCNDDVTILLTAMEVSNFGDCNLDVYIENRSDKTLSVSAPAIRLNGQEVTGHFWDTLRPGTRVVSSASIYDLDEMEITELSQMGEVSLDLHIEYMEDWYVTETVNETVTFGGNALYE